MDNHFSNEIISKKKTPVPIFIGIIVVLVVIAIILFVRNIEASPKKKGHKQLELGNKYFTELDYENALLAYEKAIGFDSNCEEAYIGLGRTYLVLAENEESIGTYEKALEYLGVAKVKMEKGLQSFNSDTINEIISQIDEAINRIYTEQKKTNTRLYKIRTYDADGVLTDWSIMEYEDNLTKKSIHYNANGDNVGWGLYEYDSNGNMTKSIRYDQAGNIQGWEEYEYDSNNQEIKQISYDMNGEIIHYYAGFEYDEHQRVIKYLFYQPDGTSKQWVSYEYNEEGLLKKDIIHTDGSKEMWAIHEYNQYGEKTKTKRYFDEGETLVGIDEYEYEVLD